MNKRSLLQAAVLLVAAGVVLSPGAKVVAVLNNVAGRTVTVRFNVK